MTVKRTTTLLIGLAITIALTSGCATMGGGAAPYENFTNVYLQNNIHYEARVGRGGAIDNNASYANYTDPGAGHKIAPVNTAVTIGKWRGGFSITRQDTGEVIYFEYKSSNMAMGVEEYLKIITAPTKASLGGLSATDMKGIKEGQALKGMSKDGVRIALGYPARHRTPSLEDNVWTYWRTRWVMRTVNFDGKGKVVSVQ
jgi:hypothetical protein